VVTVILQKRTAVSLTNECLLCTSVYLYEVFLYLNIITMDYEVIPYVWDEVEDAYMLWDAELKELIAETEEYEAEAEWMF